MKPKLICDCVWAYTPGHMPKFSSKNEFEMWVLGWKVLWSQNTRLEVAVCLKITVFCETMLYQPRRQWEFHISNTIWTVHIISVRQCVQFGSSTVCIKASIMHLNNDKLRQLWFNHAMSINLRKVMASNSMYLSPCLANFVLLLKNKK